MRLMMSAARVTGASVALFLSGCSSRKTDFVAERDDVSMVRLLANPSAFEGSQIATRGYLHMDTDTTECALYLGEDDYRHHLSRNAVAVNLPSSTHRYADRLNNRHVWMRGIFTAASDASGRHGGALTQVVLVDVLPDPDELGPTNGVFLRIGGDTVEEVRSK